MATVVVAPTYYPGTYVLEFMNWIVGIIEIAFAVRLLLKLFAASESAAFVAATYEVTDRLLGPFAGMFPTFSLGGGYVVDVTAIVAMVVYAIVGWLIIRLLSSMFVLTSVSPIVVS